MGDTVILFKGTNRIGTRNNAKNDVPEVKNWLDTNLLSLILQLLYDPSGLYIYLIQVKGALTLGIRCKPSRELSLINDELKWLNS